MKQAGPARQARRMELGSILRQARLEARLTQETGAQAVGVTRHALCRWESGARPVRSDDADRVLAACGRDVRFRLVTRHAEVDDTLERLSRLSVGERYVELVGLLQPDALDALQATGGVVFTGAWAAAALGLPPLTRVGGFLVSDDPTEQAAAAAILSTHNPLSLAVGGPWGVTWDAAVFQRHPAEHWHASLLGEFTTEVVSDAGAETSRPTNHGGRGRVVEPSRRVPESVDEAVLGRWRALRAT